MKKILSLMLVISILASVFVPVSYAAQLPQLKASPSEADYTEYMEIFVAPNGSDSADGTLESPLATMKRAKELAAEHRDIPVFVNFRGGEYDVSKSASQVIFNGETDSRTADAPLVFRAYNDEKVTFKGSVKLDNSDFVSVTDEEVLSRIPESARERVLRLDLSPYLDGDVFRFHYGDTKYGGRPGYKLLYADGVMQQLARWPNTGYARIKEVYEKGAMNGVIKFNCGTADASRWSGATDAVVGGFMYYTWMSEYSWINKIYTDVNIIQADASPYGAADDGRYFVCNLIEELDLPGEWFIDRNGNDSAENDVLYYYPMKGFADAELELAALYRTMVSITNCENITFEGLNFENTCREAFEILDSSNINIINCNMKNIGRTAIVIQNGTDNLVQGCEISQTSAAGIIVSGGDPNTLTPCNHTIINNHIHNTGLIYTTSSDAVEISGVGINVVANLIHSTPSLGIRFAGNDHKILYNELHNVASETSDMGAVYCGRSIVDRGTEIAYNYIHDIYSVMNTGRTYDVKAIYIDDMQNGINIHHNTIANTKLGITIAGGRDNRVENNIFYNVNYAIDLHVRGMEGIYQRYEVEEGGYMYQKAYDRLFTQGAYELYTERYPAIADVFNSDGTIKAGTDMGKPENNIIKDNLIANSGNIFLEPSYTFVSPADKDATLQAEIKNAFENYSTIENNIASDNVSFVSVQNQDYTISNGDAILTAIPGLKDISTLDTGLSDVSTFEDGLKVTKADDLAMITGGNLKENSFVLVWNKGTNADYYRVRVSTNPSMDDPVKNIVTTDNSILIEGLGTASDYYITVQAYNDSRQNIGISMPKSDKLEFSVGYFNPADLFVAIKSPQNKLELAQRFDSDLAENREQTVSITVPDDAESTWRIETFLWDSDLKPLYIPQN